MIPLQLSQCRTILCLGAHADDIEIGCGGTLLRLLAENPHLSVCWVVFSGAGERLAEARSSAEHFLAEAGERRVLVESFRDSFFPYDGPAIKEFLHRISRDVQPDVVFTHRREDMHQDHRLLAELSWNAFRNHLILEYEIPKYEGDLGHPNFYIPLSEATCREKVEATHRLFASQQAKPWFTPDTLWSLLRLRGLECNSPSRYAEAFTCRKVVL
jgi:LmbE family N-acetylglucosaminyl deacetylase